MASDVSLFKTDLVFFDWECDSAEDLFKKMEGILLEKGHVNDGWLSGITTREKNYPTGLQVPSMGIAIPHTDTEFIEDPYIAVIKPKKPIMFEPMAGMGDPVPAEIIINLGVLRDGGQVAVLQNLMNIFIDEEKAADVISQTTAKGMIETITKYFE
ncbi:MAG: PTS sugar transporter subunit IIA [Collinsella sp.]|nr:PTS sugar transporter subunit IIA [Collinsella sp.]